MQHTIRGHHTGFHGEQQIGPGLAGLRWPGGPPSGATRFTELRERYISLRLPPRNAISLVGFSRSVPVIAAAEVRADIYFIAVAAVLLVASSIRAATSLGCDSMAR